MSEEFDHRLINTLGEGPLEFWMSCGGNPLRNNLLELGGGHAGMAGCDNREQALFAGSSESFDISSEDRSERLLLLPFGMLRREHLHPVEGKEHLKIYRLLAPERAVIVEGRDALVRWYEVG